jgi:hypothetical protein
VNLIGRICPVLLCLTLCSSLPAQQPPATPPAGQTPAPPQAPPPPVQAQAVPTQEPEHIENMFSIALFDWVPFSASTGLHAGAQAVLPPPHELTLPGKPYRAYGAMITFPAKGSSRLEFSYTTLNANGRLIAPTDLGLFAGTIPQGEPLATSYSLRHFKLSYNFLTYPNPPQDAKFRVKTLWEFHYLQLYPSVTATVSGPFQPLTATQSIKLPAVGLGMEYVASRHFRLEMRGSGMAIPHHTSLADAEGSAVVRVRSLEIFAGAKFLHFKTSAKQDTFMSGTIWGPDAGVRWVFR